MIITSSSASAGCFTFEVALCDLATSNPFDTAMSVEERTRQTWSLWWIWLHCFVTTMSELLMFDLQQKEEPESPAGEQIRKSAIWIFFEFEMNSHIYSWWHLEHNPYSTKVAPRVDRLWNPVAGPVWARNWLFSYRQRMIQTLRLRGAGWGFTCLRYDSQK